MTPRFANPIDWEDSLPIRRSSPLWRACVRGYYGAELTGAERRLVLQATGGVMPAPGSLEFLAIVGRRGGKSDTGARIAGFECTQVPHAAALAPGQQGLFAIISPLREQSQEILNYAKGLFALPQLRRLVANVTRDSIEFKSNIALKVMTCDAVAISGPTLIGCIRDEWAKWPGSESATPDTEIENSLRPALAPVMGAPPRRLIGISSAYIRDGLAFETEQQHHGAPAAPVFCVRGTTAEFNPNIDKAWLAREQERDARAFAREYLAEWQEGLSDGVFAEVLDRCVDKGRANSPPAEGARYYVATDPAWARDSWAAAVVHREEGEDGRMLTIVDAVEVWTPTRGQKLSTRDTLRKLLVLAKSYNTRRVFTDQAAAAVLIEQADGIGLLLEERPWTGVSKPVRFMKTRSEMADGLIRLPDNRRLLGEFRSIRSRLLRSGGEQFEAARGHDDMVSAVVLAATEAIEAEPRPYRPGLRPTQDFKPRGRWHGMPGRGF